MKCMTQNDTRDTMYSSVRYSVFINPSWSVIAASCTESKNKRNRHSVYRSEERVVIVLYYIPCLAALNRLTLRVALVSCFWVSWVSAEMGRYIMFCVSFDNAGGHDGWYPCGRDGGGRRFGRGV